MKKQKTKTQYNLFQKKYLFILIGIILIIVLIFIFKPKENINPNNTVDTNMDVFKKEGELTFLSRDNKFIKKIDIEIADNDNERTLGLMFRPFMKEDRGMLFIFDQVQPLSFWMKNTMISLDIIFVNSNKEIITIHKNTTPYLEKSYPSTEEGLYVVEVIAGFCDKYGINIGDKITYNRL